MANRKEDNPPAALLKQPPFNPIPDLGPISLKQVPSILSNHSC